MSKEFNSRVRKASLKFETSESNDAESLLATIATSTAEEPRRGRVGMLLGVLRSSES